MPLFVIIGYDGPRGLELRKQHRAAHLAKLEPLAAAGRVRFAGPLKDPEGNPQGSVIVIEAESLAAARELAAADPYVRNGIFERYEVFASQQVFPSPD